MSHRKLEVALFWPTVFRIKSPFRSQVAHVVEHRNEALEKAASFDEPSVSGLIGLILRINRQDRPSVGRPMSTRSSKTLSADML